MLRYDRAGDLTNNLPLMSLRLYHCAKACKTALFKLILLDYCYIYSILCFIFYYSSVDIGSTVYFRFLLDGVIQTTLLGSLDYETFKIAAETTHTFQEGGQIYEKYKYRVACVIYLYDPFHSCLCGVVVRPLVIQSVRPGFNFS